MSCAICGAETAVSVYRCALHRRPSFYAGRMTQEQAQRRVGLDAQYGGEERAQPGTPLPREFVLGALVEAGARGGTISELRESLRGHNVGAVQSALTYLRHLGHVRAGDTREANQALRWWATEAGRAEHEQDESIASRVRGLMADGHWRTAEEVARHLGTRRNPVANALSSAVATGRAQRDPTGRYVLYRWIGAAA